MKSTGRHSENSGYLVILLLVVGLTAFSHSMKELTEIHQLTFDASRLVAQWSGNFTPAEIPQTSIQVVKVEKLESCEISKQSVPAVELPWLNETPKETVAGAIVKGRPAKLKKPPRTGIEAGEFEVRIPYIQIPEAVERGSTPELPEFSFRARVRKPGGIKYNPRDREMILKTLNRSINLRSAG